MLFGIYYPYWEKEWGGDALAYIPKVKKLGFDALEVATADFANKDKAYFSEMKKIADDNSIKLTGGYGPAPCNNIGTDNLDLREKAFDFYKKMFEQMEIAGIDRLGGALYSYWPVTDLNFDKAKDFENSVIGMQKLADIAVNYGITILEQI
ncbi:MAG: TIM barrel protein [Eubacteriales bacterium]|nr:TIM barrel protein [Eubacteriales bacterium]